ncbi:efflux RND transporter periplasmic adaptor subunit [Winogradskyella sp. PE311]|uniref:efflux RND transporter periplasmic adaptor subunit n=1 Tax=Winogradskyella sp. PE311 TaxID=3366943 RepID=UPI00397EE8AE
MKKKIVIYISLIVFGFAISYLIFGNKSVEYDSSIEIWMCSMHPQVKKEEGGKCPLCAMDLVLKITDEEQTELTQNQFKMSAKALALANIETSKVMPSNNFESSVLLSGIIETNKETDATQTSIFEGRIEEFYANYVGSKISKGKIIGRIYSPELYLAQNKLLTSVSYRNTHRELFDEVRNSLGLWKLTDQQIENIIIGQKPMKYFPIYADVSGTVTEVIASEGDFYKEGDPLLKISDLRKVWAVFDAYESQLGLLKVGQNVEINTNIPLEENITGKIDFIEPILDKNKRTSSVRVVLNNRNGKLKPGMLLEASVKSKLTNKGLTVPKTAVLWTGKRSIVYRKPHPNKLLFEITEIILGRSVGNNYEVLSGLEFGDVVVTDGAFTIDAAAQLQGKKSMMNFINSENTQNIKSQNNKDFKSKSIQIAWDKTEKPKVDDFIKNYLEMKNAFVSSDAIKVKISAKKLLNSIEKLSLKNTTNKNSLTEVSNLIESIISQENISKQREYLKPLSDIIIKSLSDSAPLDYSLFVQYCPMADNNKGAKWLSKENTIKNPYYGDTMLNCGKVVEEIK